MASHAELFNNSFTVHTPDKLNYSVNNSCDILYASAAKNSIVIYQMQRV